MPHVCAALTVWPRVHEENGSKRGRTDRLCRYRAAELRPLGVDGRETRSRKPMRTHEISVEIAAPAQTVWDLLIDLPRYPAWNPTIPAAAGQIALGETLTLRLDFPDRQQLFEPRVVEIRPGRLLLLAKALLHRRILYATHAFLIESLAADRSRLVQRWELSGLLSRVVWPKFRAGLPAFEKMNESVKREAERSHGEHVDCLTSIPPERG